MCKSGRSRGSDGHHIDVSGGDDPLECGSCGTQLVGTPKFCGECGAPLDRPQVAAEYKQVTVLFADVVHSMDLAAVVGAERLREIMADLFDRSSAVVKRYGGTVDKFTGDGIMAVFGAPMTLEDHAIRACIAALEIQNQTAALADDVANRDGIVLQLRVGLNSGQVIAGEIGSHEASYTAVGEQVGMAQRMESIASPGNVMLSESTARLVEHAVLLGETELHPIKGASAPVRARRLLAIEEHQPRQRNESKLVGRTRELNFLSALVDEAIGGAGCVVNIVGPPGIGKSRLARETAALAANRGAAVVTVHCESHTSDVPFRLVSRMFRASMGIDHLDAAEARAQVRAQFSDADAEDLRLLEDLLGIADADLPPSDVTADARRRRLAAMINAAALAQTKPAVYVIEDVHWIDETSESMLAQFISVIPQTPTLVLITSRPEYQGALVRVSGAQTIGLRPLNVAEGSTLAAGLLGADPSLADVAAQVSARAAGNPFFAEEMVRDLAERGLLAGAPGAFELRRRRARRRCACHPAGHDRCPHRSAERRGQTHAWRRRRDRVTIRCAVACRRRRLRGCGTAHRGGTGRPGEVRTARRVCVSPPADPRGCLRITTQVGSCRTAPTSCRRHRNPRPRSGGRERGADRRALSRRRATAMPPSAGTCGRAHGWPTVTSRLRARVGDAHSRLPTDCRTTIRTGCRCVSRHARCCAEPRIDWAAARTRASMNCATLCTASGDLRSLAIGLNGHLTVRLFDARRRGGISSRRRADRTARIA